jgi:hypothetical protein
MSQLQQEISKKKIAICFCSRLETYRLDACYGEETKTREIFVAEMDAMIASLCQGLNSTVFALGAIGGGKTHTMKVRILGSRCPEVYPPRRRNEGEHERLLS